MGDQSYSSELGYSELHSQVQTILSAHLSNQKLSDDFSLLAINDRASSAAASSFNPSKLDLNILMGKRKGTFPAFFSGVTNDLSVAQHDGLIDSSSTSKSDAFFSFSKTTQSLSLNSYLRENRISLPFVSFTHIHVRQSCFKTLIPYYF